jgi:hypothetical protein
VPDAIDPAEFVDAATAKKPELTIHGGDLPATTYALRDLLARSAKLFDRGVPVRIVIPGDGGIPTAVPLTRHGVVMLAHELCEPVRITKDGERRPETLPDRVAQMYLDLHDWSLPYVSGISTAPLLLPDGSVRFVEGYDPRTKLWCANPPALDLPVRPDEEDAIKALDLLRREFRTFPFADAVRRSEHGLDVVDVERPPEYDESAYLVALMTAVCRPSLCLAPGLLMTAASVSGAGTGKGLSVRAICAIAFGMRPRAFTTGSDRHELDKRLAAELIEAQPVLFLDNANGMALRSDLLASVLTERASRVRLLGQTRMVPVNGNAFIAVTGNGLTVAEDLARRFLHCEFDAHCEDPEVRSFKPGFLENIEQRRPELLAAVLTIWRFSRQNRTELARGKPLGSFETWAEWCRDPLLTLGCRDPVERVERLKSRDPQRQRIAEFFTIWWAQHKSTPVTANDLAHQVKAIIDPQGRGRQYLAVAVMRLAGTRAAGFVLSRQESAGIWTPATYALMQDVTDDRSGHQPHQSHVANGHARWPG